MRALSNGQQEALGPLYGRYATLVFHIGQQSLDRAAAEELVQEVFLAVWRGAGSFDPAQGDFKPWLLRLTHWKILNELRRRRRHPVGNDPEDDDAVDADPGPEERAGQSENEQLVQSALASLPDKQRQAVMLAFLNDMTHQQVASALDVPLGTAKTRIRSGLQILRLQLAPIAASLLGIALVAIGWRYFELQRAFQRDERALPLVTQSDLVPLRLTPAPAAAVPAGAHANYRGRAGNPLAVLTVEELPPAPAGATYQAWARHGDAWTSLGTLVPETDGSGRLIAEDTALATVPDAVEITVEPARGSAAPTGQPVLAWPSP
jgi:RNA polymerase sigma-70 factor (ECF subfamily)